MGGGQPPQPGAAAPAPPDGVQCLWLAVIAWMVAQGMFWPRAAAAEQLVAAAHEAAAGAQLQAAARVAGAELQAATAAQRAAVAEQRAAAAEAIAARACRDAAVARLWRAVWQAQTSHEASLRQHFQAAVMGQQMAEAAQAADIAALGPPVPDRPQ